MIRVLIIHQTHSCNVSFFVLQNNLNAQSIWTASFLSDVQKQPIGNGRSGLVPVSRGLVCGYLVICGCVCLFTPLHSCVSLTYGVLQQMGELAVSVGDVGSPLSQGSQHVRQGRQAAVDTWRLPQGGASYPRHSYMNTDRRSIPWVWLWVSFTDSVSVHV